METTTLEEGRAQLAEIQKNFLELLVAAETFCLHMKKGFEREGPKPVPNLDLYEVDGHLWRILKGDQVRIGLKVDRLNKLLKPEEAPDHV